MSMLRRWLACALLCVWSRPELLAQNGKSLPRKVADRISRIPAGLAAEAEKKPIPEAPVSPRPLGSDLPGYHPSRVDAGTSTSRNAANLDGSIGLRDALAFALIQSPELASFGWEIRAREARILQAGRPPNPVFSTLFEEFGRTTSLNSPGVTGPGGVIQPQATIQMSQLIELGGKRAARQKLALLTRDLAAWDYETVRIDVLTRVTKVFLDVLASQETFVLAEQTTNLVDKVQQAVGLRVDAGVVSPIELTLGGHPKPAIRGRLKTRH